MAKNHPPSERSRLKRLHQRGAYDRAAIDTVLDAGIICHVGYVIDGMPYVTPTIYWRAGDHVYWHGSSASRMLRKSSGSEVCLTVTHMDGYVLARSGFHHSANYRSVMLFGKAHKVTGTERKTAHLKAFVDKLFPGRWDELRPMTAQELKATTILALKIDEASAKIRNGGPSDDKDDYQLPIWAGVIPVAETVGTAIADPRNLAGIAMPDHVKNFARNMNMNRTGG